MKYISISMASITLNIVRINRFRNLIFKKVPVVVVKMRKFLMNQNQLHHRFNLKFHHKDHHKDKDQHQMDYHRMNHHRDRQKNNHRGNHHKVQENQGDKHKDNPHKDQEIQEIIIRITE